MGYGHAERNRIASQLAIDETIELLLRLRSLNEEQTQFVQKFAPERLGGEARRMDYSGGVAMPKATTQVTR